MNILMIHQHYYPEMSGTARRTKELAENFVKKGAPSISANFISPVSLGRILV